MGNALLLGVGGSGTFAVSAALCTLGPAIDGLPHNVANHPTGFSTLKIQNWPGALMRNPPRQKLNVLPEVHFIALSRQPLQETLVSGAWGTVGVTGGVAGWVGCAGGVLGT